MSATFAVIAGGGTGGHVTPALAVAQALVSRGHPPSAIRFVGSRRGVETRMVPAAGFELIALPGRGIERRISFRSLLAAVALAVGVVGGVLVIARLRPRVVVSVGGYASLPCAVGAVLLRRPLVVVEQNKAPSAANRLVARFARASAVPFEGTPLPRPVVCGNPIRPEFAVLDRSRDRDRIRRERGLPADRFVVAVVTGSLGSRSVNQAVIDAVRGPLGHDSRLAIVHVTGARDWAALADDIPQPPPEGCWYQAIEYEDDVPALFAAADLAVCRAGGTVFELAALALPAVLVPLPGAPGDHQTANARAVEAAGGGVLVPDHEIDGDRIAAEVQALVADPATVAAMAAGMATLARTDAADRVADLVEEHARG